MAKSIKDMSFEELETYCNSKEVKSFNTEVEKALQAIENAKLALSQLKNDERFEAVEKYNRNIKSREWHKKQAELKAQYEAINSLPANVQEEIKKLISSHKAQA